MKRIYRRDFEPQIEKGINVITCVIDNDEMCEKCLKDLEEYSSTLNNENVKFSKYDVMMDIDINEKYEISYPPYILIFSDKMAGHTGRITDRNDLIRQHHFIFHDAEIYFNIHGIYLFE